MALIPHARLACFASSENFPGLFELLDRLAHHVSARMAHDVVLEEIRRRPRGVDLRARQLPAPRTIQFHVHVSYRRAGPRFSLRKHFSLLIDTAMSGVGLLNKIGLLNDR